MARLLLRRAASLLVTLAVASVLIFTALQIAPGDPAAFMLGLNADPQAVAALRAELGLEGTAVARYVSWIGGLVQGDLGVSYTYRVPVGELIAERLGVTLPLTVLAMALSIALSVPLGLVAAHYRGRWPDAMLTGATQLGVAIPNFWLAFLLVFVFATVFRLVSAGGFPGWGAGPGPALSALILPTLALALPQAAILTRVTRGALLETLGEDYIRTARAKGLTARQTLVRHALPNAMIPVLTILGLQFTFLLAGGVIVENVFYLPGLGRLVFQAIVQRDLIVVQSAVMLLVAIAVAVTFLVDLAYAAVDPRVAGGRP